MNKPSSKFTLFVASVLILIAVLFLIVSLIKTDNKKAQNPSRLPDSPAQAIDPGQKDVSKNNIIKGRYIQVVGPKGTSKAAGQSNNKGQLTFFNGKNDSFLVRVDAARADEPVYDRLSFASFNSQVQKKSYQGTPAYLITTRYRNGFVRLTYLAQFRGSNYNVGALGRRKDLPQLKKKLMAIINSMKVVGPPPQ